MNDEQQGLALGVAAIALCGLTLLISKLLIPIMHPVFIGIGRAMLAASILLAFLYLALVSQLLGFFPWYKGMAIGGVARVSQSQLLQPFVTIIATALILNESISLGVCLFACAVIATVFMGKKMPIHTIKNGQ